MCGGDDHQAVEEHLGLLGVRFQGVALSDLDFEVWAMAVWAHEID